MWSWKSHFSSLGLSLTYLSTERLYWMVSKFLWTLRFCDLKGLSKAAGCSDMASVMIRKFLFSLIRAEGSNTTECIFLHIPSQVLQTEFKFWPCCRLALWTRASHLTSMCLCFLFWKICPCPPAKDSSFWPKETESSCRSLIFDIQLLPIAEFLLIRIRRGSREYSI